MQRVRVGLTGLACVFLLVFLAAAFFGLARPDPSVPGTSDAAAFDASANTVAAEPREPLAEMGVTPGNVPATAEAVPPVPAILAPIASRAAPGQVPGSAAR